MFAQAPIIGVLLGLVFGAQSDTVPAWCLAAIRELGDRAGKAEAQKSDQSVLEAMSATQDHSGAIFFMVIAAIWFGTSNAAREIVRERAIYLRERMVNLGLFNYVMSKFVLLCLFSLIQCTVMIGIVFPWLGFAGGPEAFFQELGALCAVSAIAVAIGLVISTWVSTSEAAMALTPIALIPQVVLGGLMVPMTTIKQISFLMYLIPARWGFEAAIVPEMVAVKDNPAWMVDLGTKKTSAADFVIDGHFECATAQLSADNFNGSWGFVNYETTWLPYGVLLGATFALILLLCILLKRRDPV
jgi:hypothetical protein